MQAALLDEIDVSVIVTDLDLTVLSWSAGAERLYGWTAQEAVGRSAHETVLPENQPLPEDEGSSISVCSATVAGRANTRSAARTARRSRRTSALGR